MNEPSPAAADSRPNSRAPAPNVCSASSGTSTCHSKTKVKITAMINRGRRRSSVAQTYFRPGLQVPLLPRAPALRVQLRGVHREERGEHRQVRDAVDQEADRRADERDQEPRHRRPDDPRAGERRAVEAHGVRERLLADHLHVEALARRVVDRGDDAGGERQPVDQPQRSRHRRGRDPAREDEGRERQGHDREARLGRREDPALVEAVGEHAAPRPEHEHRAERERRVHAERGAAARQAAGPATTTR